MNQLPKVRSGLEDRLIADELVILDRERESIHQLNLTATFIWSRCDGQRDLETIAEELADEYGVEVDLTLVDVEATISDFESLGLLTPHG